MCLVCTAGSDFPGVPKPPTTVDSLAPLPMVDMIAAPSTETKTDEVKPEVAEIKTEAAQEDVKASGEEQEGKMQVD